MHIAEGVLSPQVILAGTVCAAAGVAWGLRRIQTDETPRVAVLTSAFFVASLIHVPAGPVSIHLVLNGLVGVVLGPSAFPAILIGLILQAVLFGHGGFTTLGVNTASMATGAIAAWFAYRGTAPLPPFLRGALAGGLAIAVSAALTAGALLASGKAFWPVAAAFGAGYAPLAIIESVISGFAVAFLIQVRPEVLPARMRHSIVEETSLG